MTKKSVPKKLVVVESVGPLPELGGIGGPILNPCYVPITIINKMINKHRKVYEVNPNDYTQKVLLDLKNLRKNNFKAVKEPTIIAPDEDTIAIVKNASEEKMIVPIDASPVGSRPVGDFTKK